jgi:hypothetical protein
MDSTRWVATAWIGLALVGAQPLRAEVLITPTEARLPNSDQHDRGPMLGPKVMLVSPARDARGVKSPFALELRFEARDGAKLDLDSLSVTYEKTPEVDLTERVKDFLTPTGILMPVAEAPPGAHVIHVEIKDVNGRLGGTEFTLDTAP